MNSHTRLIKHPLFTQSNTIIGKGLGRLPALDFRDKQHLLGLGAAFPEPPRTRYWNLRTVLDQGDTPQCVAFAGEAYLLAGPVKNKQWETPQALYDACQAVDEWAGQPHDGTSVRALFKVLKNNGLVKEYKWAFDIHTIMDFILRTGPMVFGTDWLTGMFAIDEYGYIQAEGNVEGGHGYPIIGANMRRKCRHGRYGALRMQNNWGTDWGQHGRAWLCLCDAEKLIKASGEACTSLELKFTEREADGMSEKEDSTPGRKQDNLSL